MARVASNTQRNDRWGSINTTSFSGLPPSHLKRRVSRIGPPDNGVVLLNTLLNFLSTKGISFSKKCENTAKSKQKTISNKKKRFFESFCSPKFRIALQQADPSDPFQWRSTRVRLVRVLNRTRWSIRSGSISLIQVIVFPSSCIFFFFWICKAEIYPEFLVLIRFRWPHYWKWRHKVLRYVQFASPGSQTGSLFLLCFFSLGW